ncbi:unnamed protein product, partial [Amoebophrya sp. A120]
HFQGGKTRPRPVDHVCGEILLRRLRQTAEAFSASGTTSVSKFETSEARGFCGERRRGFWSSEAEPL